MEFVGNGDFGLASGQKPDGSYERVWFNEMISIDEVAFDPAVFLLTKNKAKVLKKVIITGPSVEPEPPSGPVPPTQPELQPKLKPASETCTLRLVGTIPPELWNRLGTKILPKLRSSEKLSIGIDFRVSLKRDAARSITAELNQIIDDLGLLDKIEIEEID